MEAVNLPSFTFLCWHHMNDFSKYKEDNTLIQANRLPALISKEILLR